MINLHLNDIKEVLTDTELSQYFTDALGINIRYDHKRKRYLLWDNHFWREDTTNQIYNMISSYGKILYEEGRIRKNKDLHDWGIKLQNKTKLSIIYDFARRMHPICLTGDEFDTNPMLFGVKNGVIDLTTGQLRNGRKDDYISLFSPYSFDPTAKCGIWEQYLETIFEGDMELINYLQRALGYSITGDMGEQLIFICYGEGENGKSMFFSVIDKILGDYAKTASGNLFKKNIINTQTADIAELERIRFVTNAESIKGVHLDEERLKSISGGDRVTARHLYQNNFSFYPQCKIWLYTNNYPKIDDDSHGMRRRLRVIRFPYQIRKEERIDKYDQVMLHEASGILNWFIKGCLNWQKYGLKDMPESITTATEDYYDKNSPLYEFLDTYTIKEENEQLSASLLYTRYKIYMAEKRKTPESQQKFGRYMNSLHYEKIRKEEGFFYCGLKLENS